MSDIDNVSLDNHIVYQRLCKHILATHGYALPLYSQITNYVQLAYLRAFSFVGLNGLSMHQEDQYSVYFQNQNKRIVLDRAIMCHAIRIEHMSMFDGNYHLAVTSYPSLYIYWDEKDKHVYHLTIDSHYIAIGWQRRLGLLPNTLLYTRCPSYLIITIDGLDRQISEKWYLDGQPLRMQLHHKHRPAVISWYDNGQRSHEQWWVKGEMHRQNGPAEIAWYRHGQKEREIWYQHDRMSTAYYWTVSGWKSPKYYIYRLICLVNWIKNLFT